MKSAVTSSMMKLYRIAILVKSILKKKVFWISAVQPVRLDWIPMMVILMFIRMRTEII